MSGFARKAGVSLLAQLIPGVMLALFIAPSPANAELLLQQHDVRDSAPVPDVSLLTAGKSVDFCLDSNGGLMIRHRDVSLTIAAYVPPADIFESREHLRIAQRQDCPAISGISLKLSLLF